MRRAPRLLRLAPMLLALACVACVAALACVAGEAGDVGEASPPPAGRSADARASAKPRESRADVVGAATDRAPCVVAAVTDGDSFRCRDGTRVRLLLLDAPEMSQAPFGERSRDALRALLPRDDTAWLAYDVRRRDDYGRTLAHAYTAARGGRHVNRAMAAEGWATVVVFPPNVRHVDDIRADVAAARTARRGHWGTGGFSCEPIDHKRGRC